MSDFLGIDLVAGLNETQSQSRINSAIKTMQTSGKLDNIKLNINVDNKVLQTIRAFNTEMKKLSQAAQNTGKNIDQAMNPTGGTDARKGQLNNLIKEYQQLENSAKKQSQSTIEANRKEAQSVKQLLEQYAVLNKTSEKRDKSGKTTQYRYDVGDTDGNVKASIFADEKGILTGSSITENHEKINKDLEKVAQERQSIYNKLAKIRASGYGNEKQLKLFDEQASSRDIGVLQSLGKEVDKYGSSISSLSRKSKLGDTIKSMETLYKTGTIRLPRNNMLSDIRTRLDGATTTKEIDDVQSRISRLQNTLSGRDKGFLQIEKIRADNIIPSKEVSEARERLRKAQTPEQTQRVLGEIGGLEAQSNQLKANNRQMQALANQRTAIIDKINKAGQMQGAQSGVISMFKRQAVDGNADSLQRLSRNIGQYSDSLRVAATEGRKQESVLQKREGMLERLNNIEQKNGQIEKRSADLRKQIANADVKDYQRVSNEISKYNSHLQNKNRLEQAQQRSNTRVKNLREQVVGGISPENERKLLSYQRAIHNLSPDTQNLNRELQRLDGQFGRVSTAVMEADKGMARFSRQLASAMVRVPIYAATMAAMFAPMRMMQDAISQSIQIDSQMTVLERVSNGTIQMNQALENSVDIADRLGNVISEVNDGLIAFARQGYRGDELTAMTEYATLMSNVSDLSVDESASSLTAAMKGFNIEAENSVHVVNAMNEVDKQIVPYIGNNVCKFRICWKAVIQPLIVV